MASPTEYYRNREVIEEIASFLSKRWAAVYTASGRWIRWEGNRKPLHVASPDDVERLARLGARSFYGTIEIFLSLESDYDVIDGYPASVEGISSFIDIDIIKDSRLEEAWHHVIEAARVLAEWLEERAPGSVYVLWSGAGAHVRVCWKPLSKAAERRGLDPLYAAYIAAEAALHAARRRLEDIINSSGAIKIENIVGRNRLFTAPLSLHRRLPMAAVALAPEEVELFTLSWARPERYRHNAEAWRRASEGEAHDLVEEALRLFPGRAPERSVLAPRIPGAATRRARPGERGSIGRFPVMALLQAARYYVLNGDIEKAKSFGLNRAIFYAWAKYYGPARSAARRIMSSEASRYARKYSSGQRAAYARLERVPGMREEAPVSGSGWFVMGGVEQRPEDFDRNVARRFEEAGISFESAWRAALEYVSRFPPHVLRDPRLFYDRVYLPVRDAFVEKVLRGEAPSPSKYAPRRAGPARRHRDRRAAGSLLDWLGDSED